MFGGFARTCVRYSYKKVGKGKRRRASCKVYAPAGQAGIYPCAPEKLLKRVMLKMKGKLVRDAGGRSLAARTLLRQEQKACWTKEAVKGLQGARAVRRAEQTRERNIRLRAQRERLRLERAQRRQSRAIARRSASPDPIHTGGSYRVGRSGSIWEGPAD
jgi:hypothetical protein